MILLRRQASFLYKKYVFGSGLAQKYNGFCSSNDDCGECMQCQNRHCVLVDSLLNACGDCEQDQDCLPFEDDDLCTGTLICVESECQVDPGTVVTCDSGQDTQCLVNTCTPNTGLCTMQGLADGTTCDDGNTCTQNDVCTIGVCSGVSMVCDTPGECEQNPGTCEDGTCVYPQFDQCINGDGCCPAGCYADTDDNCTALCGNGIHEEGEECDVSIAEGEPGACPLECQDDDLCTVDELLGSGCQRRCEFSLITDTVHGDNCCPVGADVSTDDDCPLFFAEGAPITVCSGVHHVPTVVAGTDRFAVGCMPDAGQNETPRRGILDGLGYPLANHSLLTSDGYYYTDIQLTYLDGRFQTVYQYNCSDSGSFNVGWKWGCIDFREYNTSGTEVTPSLVFGEIGHNGHPVLDWNGSSFGVAWVSYDDIYYRQIDSDRHLVGGDRTENVFVDYDPNQGDDRDGNRTKIVWDPDTASFAIFNILDGRLYITRVDSAGTQLLSLVHLGWAFSQTFSGQFSVAYYDGAYYVVYCDQTGQEWEYAVRLIKVLPDGTIENSVEVITGFFYRYPHLVEKDGELYIFTHDALGQGRADVYNHNLIALPGKSGVLGEGIPMQYPQATYDPSTGIWGVAYLSETGNVMLQRFTE